ncbi:hypothetical protein [Kutzneria albida]|uniref:Guanylate cyclase domain-containing protein n=1 Tax=Kutzneria albida DSM 43870 TaxID=1449976 RepID=W5W470_9PSEU|nr:hypothetical protein [Kutzneria albida]AHH95261.1 hypothetical protein KALB_1891 [Kutzneria albida DSM 43870]
MSDHQSTEDEPAELPPYRAVLVVDTKEFGSNSDPGQQRLAEIIPDVLARAFERAGLGNVWSQALFPHNTGDGFGIGFPTRHLPAVVSKVLDTLQDILAERHRQLRGHGLRLRMRASLNVGPVREPDPDGMTAVVGNTVITTHRLLDAAPVRALLTRSDPDQTFLSVALSQRVFEDVVASGYSTLPLSRVVPTPVQVKEFTGTVYLYVPNPSGELLDRGLGDHQQDAVTAEQVGPPRRRGGVTNIMTGTHGGTAIQVGHLHGGLHTGDDR